MCLFNKIMPHGGNMEIFIQTFSESLFLLRFLQNSMRSVGFLKLQLIVFRLLLNCMYLLLIKENIMFILVFLFLLCLVQTLE